MAKSKQKQIVMRAATIGLTAAITATSVPVFAATQSKVTALSESANENENEGDTTDGGSGGGGDAGATEESKASITGYYTTVDKDSITYAIEGNSEVVNYGYSNSDDASSASNWQSSNKFKGLSEGTYYFFAKDSAGKISKSYKLEVYEADHLVITKPKKTEYAMNESLDLKGGKVAVYSSSDKEIYKGDLEKDFVNGDTSKSGKVDIEVTVAGIKDAFEIEVGDKVSKIEVKGVTKEYVLDASFDEKGYLEVTYEDSDNDTYKKKVDITEDMLEGFDTSKAGTKTVKVYYAGKTTSFSIKVLDIEEPVEITIKGLNSKFDVDTKKYIVEEDDDFKLPSVSVDSDYKLLGYTDDDDWDGGDYYKVGETIEARKDKTFYAICQDKEDESAVYINWENIDKDEPEELYIVDRDDEYRFKGKYTSMPSRLVLDGYSTSKSYKPTFTGDESDTFYKVGDEVEITKGYVRFYGIVREKDNTSSLGTATDGLDRNDRRYRLRGGITVNEMNTSMGYMSGYPDGTFNPDGTITREEFAAILYRVFVIPATGGEVHFTDVGENSWSRPAIERMARAGIIAGVGNGKFDPKGKITRDDAMRMLSGIVNVDGYKVDKKRSSYESVDRLMAAGIASRVDFGSNLKANLTRSEAVRLINEIVYEDDSTSKTSKFTDVNAAYRDDYKDIVKAAK